MQLSYASGSLHGSYLIMRAWRPQTEIAPFQAGGECYGTTFNFNAIALVRISGLFGDVDVNAR